MKKITAIIGSASAIITAIGIGLVSYHFGHNTGEASGKREAKYATRQSISDAAWADVEKCTAKFKASEEADMKKACNPIASTALSVSTYAMFSK